MPLSLCEQHNAHPPRRVSVRPWFRYIPRTRFCTSLSPLSALQCSNSCISLVCLFTGDNLAVLAHALHTSRTKRKLSVQPLHPGNSDLQDLISSLGLYADPFRCRDLVKLWRKFQRDRPRHAQCPTPGFGRGQQTLRALGRGKQHRPAVDRNIPAQATQFHSCSSLALCHARGSPRRGLRYTATKA